jgi:hypothetical protein
MVATLVKMSDIDLNDKFMLKYPGNVEWTGTIWKPQEAATSESVRMLCVAGHGATVNEFHIDYFTQGKRDYWLERVQEDWDR